MIRAYCAQHIKIFHWHCKHQALLGFADPNFRRRKSRIFHRRSIKMHISTDGRTHLADCTGKSTRATIRQPVIQTSLHVIACRKNCIERAFLCDRISDLYCMAEFIGVRVSQLCARKSCAMNSVATSTPSNCDDDITHLHRAMREIARHHADTTSKHKWIADVSIIEPYCSIQRWNPHAISIIANTRNNLRQHALRRDATARNRREICVGDTKNIRRCDRLRPLPCCDDVTNATTDSSCRATIRFDCTWMIVRFDLEANRILIVECDHARVVNENGKAPINWSNTQSHTRTFKKIIFPHQFMRRTRDRRLEQIMNHHSSI